MSEWMNERMKKCVSVCVFSFIVLSGKFFFTGINKKDVERML